MQQVVHELLPELAEDVGDELPPFVIVRLYSAMHYADQIVEELHDGSAGFFVVEGAGHQRALEDVRHRRALEEVERGSLEETST